MNELYKITHASTEEINAREKEFGENDREIEKVARDCLGKDIF